MVLSLRYATWTHRRSMMMMTLRRSSPTLAQKMNVGVTNTNELRKRIKAPHLHMQATINATTPNLDKLRLGAEHVPRT